MTRIRFDECISHRIVAAMKAFGVPAGIEIEHALECGDGGRADVDWLSAFKAGGGRCIVTGDPAMRGKIVERMTLQSLDLVAIFPPRKGSWFMKLGRYGQASYLIRWLPVIAELAPTAEAGAHFMLPPTFEPDISRVERLRAIRGPTLSEVTEKRAARSRSKRRDDRVMTDKNDLVSLAAKKTIKTTA
ncbi:hypothetical protein [Phenylobacterium sp.]|uniref:PIN-like domain-containing protein n=1 Tax=Phenylobacterium sp. TaxID=1871053 RepID=UPI0035AFCD43